MVGDWVGTRVPLAGQGLPLGLAGGWFVGEPCAGVPLVDCRVMLESKG